MNLDATFWENKYQDSDTGWDLGEISPPLKEEFDRWTDTEKKILIPGSGFGHEAEYLWKLGFENVYILDLSSTALLQFKTRNPDFPLSQLLERDVFEMEDTYDCIVEQTLFCAIDPALRIDYAQKMHQLLKPKGELVGLLFDFPLQVSGHPPFGGNEAEYRRYFSPYFSAIDVERCKNSHPSRQGKELFIRLKK